MFGLGLCTAGVLTVFDSHFLIRSTVQNVPANYQRWTVALALFLTFMGIVILTGTEYVVKTDIYPALTASYPYFGVVLLPVTTLMVLLVLVLLNFLNRTSSLVLVGIVAVLQFLTLAAFGIIRQIGQNAGVAKFVDVSLLPEAVQWDSLIAFVVCFLLGVGVIVWMVIQCAKCSGKPSEPLS
jgi:hypothetical protein